MNTAYLGIDVSKGYADFVLIGHTLQLLSSPVQFDDTLQGYKKCEQWLQKCIKAHGITQIRAAVESTGGLENNWLAGFKTMLKGFDLKTLRLNPATVKFATKATLSTVTTDRKSAQHIAQYLVRFRTELDFDAPVNPYAAYKKVLMQLSCVTKTLRSSKNVFRQLMYEIFPELQALCPQQVPEWLYTVLQKYPTPAKLASTSPTTLAKTKGLSLEKAKRLIQAAQHSAGSAKDASVEFILDNQIRQIRYQNEHLRTLKAWLEKHVTGPEMNLLTSITGIASYSAAVLMIHIGDISSFPSARHLASFFGVTPKIHESGDKKGLSSMSKKGASVVRATLYMCAQSAVLHDPHIKDLYTKQRAKGKNHKQALGVIMHKLLRMIWGILTTKTPYTPAIDQKNQLNPSLDVRGEQQQWNKKRRDQQFDPLAPVSYRSRKQRKEHLLPQAEYIGQVRDLESVPHGIET